MLLLASLVPIADHAGPIPLRVTDVVTTGRVYRTQPMLPVYFLLEPQDDTPSGTVRGDVLNCDFRYAGKLPDQKLEAVCKDGRKYWIVGLSFATSR